MAHKFGIPTTTLHDRLSGKSSKVAAGGPTVLSISEEREIAMGSHYPSRHGFGLAQEVGEARSGLPA